MLSCLSYSDAIKMTEHEKKNKKEIVQLLTSYLLVVLLILYLELIAFSDPRRGTDAAERNEEKTHRISFGR